MKKIDISTKKYPNTFALVDDEDYKELNKHKWSASENNGAIYAVRCVRIGDKWKTLKMHAAIIGAVEGKGTDHINCVTLDNQRKNLRHCTKAENACNRGAQVNNTSGYKGVTWYKRDGLWQAQIYHHKQRFYLGRFTCLIKAAIAYDKKAKALHGDFAYLNFP